MSRVRLGGTAPLCVVMRPLSRYLAPTRNGLLPAWRHSSSATANTSVSQPTPLVRLSAKTNPHEERNVSIYVKCEFHNPTLSIKDRMVRYILEHAPLAPDVPIVAASSGNTGASVAMLATQAGRKSYIFTSKACSEEKVQLMRALGATVEVCKSGVPADSEEHYQNVAKRFAAERGFYDLDQYDNLLNRQSYAHTLGPEIREQMQARGGVHLLVAGGSTGGTISGTGRFLRMCSVADGEPETRVVLADPQGSVLGQAWRLWAAATESGSAESGQVSEETLAKIARLTPTRKWAVEGVGKDSLPGAMDLSCVHTVVDVEDASAVATCHRMVENDNIMAGGSSGLSAAGALQVAAELEGPCNIVAVLPDAGIKYLSTIYNPDWCRDKGLPVPGLRS